MSRRLRVVLTAVLAVAVLIPIAALLARDGAPSGPALEATATEGDFAVTVTAAGELRARAFVEITGPPNAQQAGAFQMKIQTIVPEGTLVQAGDVVAELDRSTLASRLQDVGLAVQKAMAVFEQAQLDSTLTLSKAREDLRTMELALEERRIAREQAAFEAPSVRRQAEIDLEKAERALAQAKLDYVTRTEQAQAKMREVGADLARQQSMATMVQEAMAAFTIRAPSDGMVIYVKEWNGRKKGAGSQVSPWEPTVATLPDLTKMESVTYINEVDVRKVAVGQPVRITLDSDPDKVLAGTVSAVANVGEQRPNSDAKVFEVKVTVAGSDTTLRPGMTTGNVIVTTTLRGVTSVPIEAVSASDSTSVVYLRRGRDVVKQEVRVGAMNDTHVVILAGVAAGETVLLTAPAEAAALPLVRIDAR
jgi:RND family efflux transporter MFP subunit